MMTRKRQRELNVRLAEEKRTLLQDVVALHNQFERRRSPLKKREHKEKKKRTRVNHKVNAFQMEQIIELKLKQQLSYVKIGKALTLKPETIYQALRRY
jgi:hypothetical protein